MKTASSNACGVAVDGVALLEDSEVLMSCQYQAAAAARSSLGPKPGHAIKQKGGLTAALRIVQDRSGRRPAVTA